MREERYFGKDYRYIWSDHWHLEDDKGWFMSGWLDFLFEFDFKTQKTHMIGRIPFDGKCEFRQHPRCLKRKDIVICLPDDGPDIWCYHLSSDIWTKIPIENPDQKRLGFYNAWFLEDHLFIVSSGLKQIIEVDLEKERIINHYSLSSDESVQISESVLIGSFIYVVSSYPVNIYKFDCINRKTEVYPLPEIKDFMRTFCFDGNKFWMTGIQRRIYIWDEKTDKLTCLDNLFEKQYYPLFLFSLFAGKYVWLIPFKTNEIIYIDKVTLQVKYLRIEEEEQTETEIQKQLLQHKYLLEYVRENRYIGLFSLKNKWIFEIDSIGLTYKIMDYEIHLDAKVYECIMKDIMKYENIISEEDPRDFLAWIKNLQSICNKNNESGKTESAGKEIFHQSIFY